MRHVISENERVDAAVEALAAADLAALGELLNASHASLRDDYEVSVPEVDRTVEACLEAGALGARIMGGGFGGSVLRTARSACGRVLAPAWRPVRAPDFSELLKPRPWIEDLPTRTCAPA